MATSDMRLIGLTATSGIGKVSLVWTWDGATVLNPVLRNTDYSHTEVWRSAHANFSGAVHLANVGRRYGASLDDLVYVDTSILIGPSYYYKVRAIDVFGNDGVFTDAVVGSGTGTSDTERWSDFQPTPTAATGAFGNISVNAFVNAFKKIGRTVIAHYEIVFVDIGTASGYLILPLPFTAKSGTRFVGRGNTAVIPSVGLQNLITVVGITNDSGGNNTILVYRDDGTFPIDQPGPGIASGTLLDFTLTYESEN